MLILLDFGAIVYVLFDRMTNRHLEGSFSDRVAVCSRVWVWGLSQICDSALCCSKRCDEKSSLSLLLLKFKFT